MQGKSITQLAEMLPETTVVGDGTVTITGIAYDSRKVMPGNLFVAMPGQRADGHDFIPEALAKGAAGVVAEKAEAIPAGVPGLLVKDARAVLGLLAAGWYEQPSHHMRVIGVTGTNGKTTTTHLIEGILRTAGHRVGLIGTIGNRVVGQTIPTTHTTPESLDLQELLAKMRGAGAGYVVMEASSHALELHRLTGCEFDVGVFTNLTQDHLDFHLTMDRYFAAKAKLFQKLSGGQKTGPKYGLVNGDDSYSQPLMAACTVPCQTFGIEGDFTYSAREVHIKPTGVSFTVQWGKGEQLRLDLRLAGRFNVYNSLAAFGVAMQEGMDPAVAARALMDVGGVPGRFEMVDCGQPFGVVVDYAHTPDGLHNVLTTAREITPGRVITVFGCGGDRDRAKRPLMGEVAARLSDICVITSDNPRNEDPLAIIGDIEPGVIRGQGNYRVEVDRCQAIALAIGIAGPGDLVLIAGKGHEDYQIIKDRVLPFDDRQVVRSILCGQEGKVDEHR